MTHKPLYSPVYIASEQLNVPSPVLATLADLCICCQLPQPLCGRAPLQGVHWGKELTSTGGLEEQGAELRYDGRGCL